MSKNDRQRARRDKRLKNPPPIRITERDIAVIRTVHEYRIMTTQQIQQLFFPSMHRAYERLSALYHHRYLDRRFLGEYSDKMNKPVLYVLDRAGVELLRSRLGLAIEGKKVSKDATPQFLHHALAIGDVRVAVTKACKNTDFGLTEWRGEGELKADYDYITIRNERGRMVSVSLIPDSYFQIATPKGNTHFFLELDRGTMDLGRFAQKVVAYTAYSGSGLSERRFGTKRFRMLTVTESVERMSNLKHATEEVGGENRFWFSTLSGLTSETVLIEPVWSISGRDDPAILIE